MPGSEQSLIMRELKQAFFDSMPTSWKSQYRSAGKTIETSIAALISYMRFQECQGQSTIKKRPEAMTTSKQPTTTSKQPRNKKANSKPDDSNTHENNQNNNQVKRQRISNSDKCYVHPWGTHTWGECRQNAYGNNPDKGKPFKTGNDKKSKPDNNKEAYLATQNTRTSTRNGDQDPTALPFADDDIPPPINYFRR